MNILVVHNFYQQPGGEDQVFNDEVALLRERGNSVETFTVHNDVVAHLGKLALARKTLGNKEVASEIEKRARAMGANIVHFHNTFPLVSPEAYRAARAAGAKVVQTLHNYRLLCPAATFFRDGHVCEDCLGKFIPWPAVVHKCYRDNRAASATVAAMLTVHRAKGTYQHQVDRYIALTQFAKNKYIEGGLPESKIVVKSNFVSPDPGVGTGDGDYFVFVGRLTIEKGVRTLLESWRDHVKHAARLKIVGDGPLRDEVAKAASASGGSIEYVGRLPGPEVLATIGQATALVFPSVWYEGQPRTIIESFACGTPVIASDIGSMTELVRHGETGWLCTPGDAAGLAMAVNEAAAHGASLRDGARAEFTAKYTAQKSYEALQAIYDSAISPTPCPA